MEIVVMQIAISEFVKLIQIATTEQLVALARAQMVNANIIIHPVNVQPRWIATTEIYVLTIHVQTDNV